MRNTLIPLGRLSSDIIKSRSRHISKEDSEYLAESIDNAIDNNNRLKHIMVSVSDTPHPHYDPESKQIILSSKNPSKFLQELGSAHDTIAAGGHGNEVSRVVSTSRSLARALALSTVPAAVLISGNNFLSTEQKIKALDVLTGASAVAVMPALVSDMSNIGFAVRHSSNKLRTLRDSSSDAASSIGKNVSSPLGFFAARRILRSYANSEEGKKNSLDSLFDKIKKVFN